MTVAMLFVALSSPPGYHFVDGVAFSFAPIIYKWADYYHVPRELAMAIAEAESRFHANACSGSSRGLFQINAQYEAEHAKRAGIECFDWRNPEHSTRAGLAFMAYLLKKYHGDTRLALAGYNFGPANVDSGKPWPEETINYVRRILG